MRELTMEEAQQTSRRLHADGKHAEAYRIEAKYRNRPDYESDRAWLLRMQAGGQGAASRPADAGGDQP